MVTRFPYFGYNSFVMRSFTGIMIQWDTGTCVISASFEVPEFALIRELLYVFQGIEGRYIKYDAASEQYRVDPKVSCFISAFCCPVASAVLQKDSPANIQQLDGAASWLVSAFVGRLSFRRNRVLSQGNCSHRLESPSRSGRM